MPFAGVGASTDGAELPGLLHAAKIIATTNIIILFPMQEKVKTKLFLTTK